MRTQNRAPQCLYSDNENVSLSYRFPDCSHDTCRAVPELHVQVAIQRQQQKTPTMWNVVTGAALILAFYGLSFGPAWGLYKRGHIFSKSAIRIIYTPLVKVADQHLCPLDFPGQLLWSYADLCAPTPNPKIISADDTFD